MSLLARRAKGTVAEFARTDPTVACTQEPLRAVVFRMAETGFTRMPVVDRTSGDRLAGMVSLEDLLRVRARNLTEERHRERVLRIRLPFGLAAKQASTGTD